MPPHHEPSTSTSTVARPAMGAAKMFLRAMGQVARLLAGEPARRWRLRAARPGELETAGHDLTLAHAALAANWREAVNAAGQVAAAIGDAIRRLWAALAVAAGRTRRQIGPAAERLRRQAGPAALATRRTVTSGLGKAGAALLAAGGGAAARIDRVAERWRGRRPARTGTGTSPAADGDRHADGAADGATPSSGSAPAATGFRGRSGRILSALGGDRPGTQGTQGAGTPDVTQQLPPAAPTWEEEDNFWWLPSRQAAAAQAAAQAEAEAQLARERWDEPEPGPGPEPGPYGGAGTDDPPSATLG